MYWSHYCLSFIPVVFIWIKHLCRNVRFHSRGLLFTVCGSCWKEVFYTCYTCRDQLTALDFAVVAMVDFPRLNLKMNLKKKTLSIKWSYSCMANAGTACMLWMHVCLIFFFFTAYLASMNYPRKCNTEPGFESLSLEASGSVWWTRVSDSLPPQWVSSICKHDSLMPGRLFYTCDVTGGKKDN